VRSGRAAEVSLSQIRTVETALPPPRWHRPENAPTAAGRLRNRQVARGNRGDRAHPGAARTLATASGGLAESASGLPCGRTRRATTARVRGLGRSSTCGAPPSPLTLAPVGQACAAREDQKLEHQTTSALVAVLGDEGDLGCGGRDAWLLLLDEADCAEGVCKRSRQAGYGLRPVKVSELLKLLASDGWTLKRTRGSHRQFVHPTNRAKSQ
jgi:HicA toxin of bacterial toxin-antitoxin,